jgi:hypothetical protein
VSYASAPVWSAEEYPFYAKCNKKMSPSHLKQHELFHRVSLFLDNALSSDEQQSLQQEIDANPVCLEMLNKEQSFREFVKSRVHRHSAAPNLIQSIREKAGMAPL